MYLKSIVGGRLLGLVGIRLTFCNKPISSHAMEAMYTLTGPNLPGAAFLEIDCGVGMLNLGTEGTRGAEEFTEVLLISREWPANDG